MRLRHAALLAASMSAFAFAAPAGAATTTVTVGQGGDRFTPADITITQGDTVTWNWADGDHDISGRGPESFSTGFRSSGSWSRQFNVSGSYTYVCTAHSDMRGSITVNAAPAPTTPAQPGPAPGTTAPPAGGGATTTAPSTQAAAPASGTTATGSTAPASASTVIRSTSVSAAKTSWTSLSRTRALATRGVPVVRKLRAVLTRSAARMAVDVTENARLAVSVRRLGRNGRLVFSRRLAVFQGRNPLTVSLRGLRAGRYRVRVVAIDAEGHRSPARTVTLRYRGR